MRTSNKCPHLRPPVAKTLAFLLARPCEHNPASPSCVRQLFSINHGTASWRMRSSGEPPTIRLTSHRVAVGVQVLPSRSCLPFLMDLCRHHDPLCRDYRQTNILSTSRVPADTLSKVASVGHSEKHPRRILTHHLYDLCDSLPLSSRFPGPMLRRNIVVT